MLPSFVSLALVGTVLICGHLRESAAAPSSSSGPAAKPPPEPAPVGVRAPLSVHVGDELADRRLTYLATRSATMKQILGVLEMTPAISVRLRSNAILWRESRHKGVGRFWRDGAQVVVLLQFDSVTARPLEQIESVAHEMAHVVEVACLPHLIEIAQLRGQMLRRGRLSSGASGVAIETPFAGDAGRQIVLEALRGRPGIGRLPELAEKYKLGFPCADFRPQDRVAATR